MMKNYTVTPPVKFSPVPPVLKIIEYQAFMKDLSYPQLFWSSI